MSLGTKAQHGARSATVGAGAATQLFGVDFFCGAGGMTEGLKQAGVTVVAGVDLDASVGATYEANHSPGARFIHADVRDCGAADVRAWLPSGTSPDDVVLVGCSPCQHWTRLHTQRERSMAGRALLVEFGRIVDAYRPGFVVVENVPGLGRQRGTDEVLGPFIAQLIASGFAVCHGVVSAASYGVPQLRKRLLLVATRRAPSLELPPRVGSAAPTVRQFIGRHNGFASLGPGDGDPSDTLHRAADLSVANRARIAATPVDGGDRSAWRDSALQIPAYQGRDDHFRNVYGRMFWDQPGPTLTTRFNSLSNGRFGHPEENRAITLREGATLQTFPRSYVFSGSMPAVSRQIGNAVPPALAHAVGRHFYEIARRGAAPAPGAR